MIERVREILQRPKTVGRALLTGVLLTGAACAPAQVSGQQLKCPTRPAEVSRLVGGDPRNWKPIEERIGSWSFDSQEEQVLNGAQVGRVDTPHHGRVHLLHSVAASRGWYVCVEGIDKGGTLPPISIATPAE